MKRIVFCIGLLLTVIANNCNAATNVRTVTEEELKKLNIPSLVLTHSNRIAYLPVEGTQKPVKQFKKNIFGQITQVIYPEITLSNPSFIKENDKEFLQCIVTQDEWQKLKAPNSELESKGLKSHRSLIVPLTLGATTAILSLYAYRSFKDAHTVAIRLQKHPKLNYQFYDVYRDFRTDYKQKLFKSTLSAGGALAAVLMGLYNYYYPTKTTGTHTQQQSQKAAHELIPGFKKLYETETGVVIRSTFTIDTQQNVII